MKNIAAQMVNFDREQMRRIANNMPEQYDEKPQVQQVAQIINGVFSQLLATFPASLANRDQNELNEIRRQWVLAFRENGITTMEQVNAGMRVARRQNRPFLPSPGQFVAWCREEASVIAGLPNVSELVDMVYEYCRKRGLYPDAESYPWKSNAHYWLVTNLYQNMRANALTDAELRRKAADELVHMTARINRGEAIPEPVKQLPVMGGIGLAMPVKIRIECHMPDRRRRDLDNLQKAAFDALTKAGFWLDDAQVVDYRVVKMPVTKGGRLKLTITEMGNE
ncbi:TPA: RusA family crossover junction endodeoxyribonuclease [Escherichia coli]|nr:RusA family crossover junction endodeoxyribonuclease [Escherichia coli]